MWRLISFHCRSTVLVLLLVLLLSVGHAYSPEPVPLVLPVPGKAQLALQQAGLDFLASIAKPVSPVVVIGPYRSGKSFLLNQLLGVTCNKGFGVGHTRSTQTKGVWVWGEPRVTVDAQGRESMVLFFDTEGFESTGRANSYDDRIFALSTILSSVLIYNLPETIRESDIAKLSFAVDLAGGFYERSQDQQGNGSGERADAAGVGGKTRVLSEKEREQEESRAGGRLRGSGSGSGSTDSQRTASLRTPHAGAGTPAPGALEPGAMLWVIQRDFLQGKTANELVHEVLAPVPNPQHDKDLDHLNQIRASLSTIAHNSTGVSLRQPHLERTKLCDLADTQLDPVYLAQRDTLKHLVQALALPKQVGGRPVTGMQLADLVSQVIKALNAQEIPNAASMIDAFNRDIVARSLAQYVACISKFVLPIDEAVLAKAEAAARRDALLAMRSSLLGRARPGTDVAALLGTQMDHELALITATNLAQSAAACTRLENKCEADLDGLQGMRLPSLFKFKAAFRACEQRFLAECVGPARTPNQERLAKAWVRADKAFKKDYNDKLFTGLVVLSLALVVVFRFMVKVQVMELLGWGAFLFLEVYPYVHPGNMYDTRAWAITVHVWEAAMFALFGWPLATFVWGSALIALVAWQLMCRGRGRRRKRAAQAHPARRDLDV